ncbi:MAG: hypothetical protein KC496_10245, partial [Anaerolineae bacterium]|nr:hypothetical protein [Anaerolineae bacterium]
MMSFLRQTFLTSEVRTQNPLARRSAQGLLYLLFFASLTLTPLVLGIYIYSVITSTDVSGFLIPITIALVTVALLYILVRQGYYFLAARGLVLLGVVLSYFQMRDVGIDHYSVIPTAMFPIIVASTLSFRSSLLTFALVLIAGFHVILIGGMDPAQIEVLVSMAIILVALLAMTVAFTSYVQTPALDFIQELQSLQRAAQLSILPDPMTDERQVYAHVLRLLVNEMGHTVAQVYRVDDRGNIQQRVGVGFYLGGMDIQDEVEISQN